MATYNSAGSGNFNVDATWTETGHPSTGDTAVIASGHTVTMTADDAVGSIDIQGTLTTDGTARTLTLDANAQGYICEHRGTVSTTINLVINSDFAGDKLIRLNNGGNGNFNDVSITLQSTSRKLTIGTEAASIDGDLTITQGIFDTDSSNNYAITVTGDISVVGTLIGNTSAISSRKLTTTGTLNGGNFTVTGSGLGNTTRTIDLGGTVTGNVDITLTGAGNNRHEDLQASGNIRNLTINNAAAVIHTGRNTTIDGDLTITAGTLSTDDGGTSVNLTVAGDASVTGTLTGNASAISLGSLTIASGGTYSATSGTTTITSETSGGYAIDHDGTFTHNNGTVLITTPATTLLDLLATGNLYNLTINHASCVARIVSHSTIDNDVTVTAGTLNTAYDVNVTVTGDVSVSGTFGLAEESGAHSFGSLTIESGGTHIATSGTTTITSETSGGFAMVDQGTFTHNNGTIQIGDGSTSVGSGTHTKVDTFYNLTVNMASTTVMVLMRPNSGSTMTVLNNVTVQNGVLTKNSHTNTFDFGGLVTVGIGGGSLAAHIDSTTSGTATDNFGALTILTDGKYTQPTTTNVSSIRNVGGTIA